MSELEAILPVRDHLGDWILACVLAETIGMVAAATAAGFADGIGNPVLGLGLIVLGGLVEGSALGGLQSRALARRHPTISRTRWFLVTSLVAGLGWAAASIPAVFDTTGGKAPAMGVIILAAAGLGLAMGAILGVFQSLTLRRVVRHPWRWTTISAVAWLPTMAIIFVGATLPDATWPRDLVALWAIPTGATAGAVLGLISGWAMPLLDGGTLSSRALIALMRSPLGHALAGSIALLTVRGRLTGRRFELPVQYAFDGTTVVLYPAHAAGKTWWRNLREPSGVDILLAGRERRGIARIVRSTQNDFWPARRAYHERWPGVIVPIDSLLVVVELVPEGSTNE